MSRTITPEEFTAAMIAAVQERGAHYTYPTARKSATTNHYGFVMYTADSYHGTGGECKYSTPDGTPACIIGLALHKIDPDLVPNYSNSDPARAVLAAFGLGDEVQAAADAAQRTQDLGGSWGMALRDYKRVLSEEF